MNPSKTYINKLLVVVAVIYIFIVLMQYALYRNNLLPAAPVSSSLSFNEKLGWISNLDKINCDVLITGSSLALNNTDSSIYRSYANNSFINIASWGMTIKDNNDWLNLFVTICEPKKIILLLSSNDFRNVSSSDMKNFDLDKIKAILSHIEQAYDYTDIKNIYYVLKNIQSINDEKTSRAMKGSLFFDSGGSVPIDYKDWSLEKSWLKGFVPPEKINKSTYDDFSVLLKALGKKDIEVLVVLTPIRSEVFDSEKSNFLVFTNIVKNVTEKHNVGFMNLTQSKYFADEDYSDVTHLNQRGATKLSSMIVDHMRQNDHD